MNSQVTDSADVALFEELAKRCKMGPGPIFILHSPRAGSTFFYQLLASAFNLPYFSNFINNYFSDRPLTGLALQLGLPIYNPIRFTSNFGKTVGIWQPAEASNVMRNWFGGDHPSETASREFLEGKEDHCRYTLEGVRYLSSQPLINKNAWNSFRVKALFRACPDASFIWIKRDISAASESDLAARYIVQDGNPLKWNSATPYNVEKLEKLPYWSQVVENQFEFARAISSSFKGLPENQFTEIWYEDLIENVDQSLRTIKCQLSCLGDISLKVPVPTPDISSRSNRKLCESDIVALHQYIEANSQRLSHLMYE